MLYIHYLIVFTVIGAITAQEAVVQINTKKPAYYVSDKFLSFSIDAQHVFGDESISSNDLQIARMLSPAYVRISGVPPKQVGSDDWKKCYTWMRSADLTPVVALDYEVGNWHPRDVIEFLGMSREIGVEDCVWQLGKRLNTSIVQKYSDDIQTLDHIIDVMTSGGRWGNWHVAASDMELDWDTDEKKIRSYLSKIGPRVNIITMRSRQSDEDDSLEDDSLESDNEAPQWSYSPRTNIWLSRPAVPTIEGNNGCCDVCLAEGLRYAKGLGEASKSGYSVMLQDIKLTDISPNLEFFITMLHKQLMGPAVLDTTTMKNDADLLHFYTHCTANASDEMAGSITVFGINMDEEEMIAIARLMHRPKEGEMLEYILTVRDNEIYINEELASTSDQPFPHVKTIRPRKSITFSLPPKSVGFWIIPANSKACMGSNNYIHKIKHDKIHKLRRTSATNLLEDLIIESLNSNKYTFLDNGKKESSRNIKKTNTAYTKTDNDPKLTTITQDEHSNNKIYCKPIPDEETETKQNKKRPLSNLMASKNKEMEEDRSSVEENVENTRTKRDVSLIKKPQYKRHFELYKNMKKPSKPLIDLTDYFKKNSAEYSLQDEEKPDFPTGDVYVDIENEGDQKLDLEFVKDTKFNTYNKPQPQYKENNDNEYYIEEKMLKVVPYKSSNSMNKEEYNNEYVIVKEPEDLFVEKSNFNTYSEPQPKYKASDDNKYYVQEDVFEFVPYESGIPMKMKDGDDYVYEVANDPELFMENFDRYEQPRYEEDNDKFDKEEEFFDFVPYEEDRATTNKGKPEYVIMNDPEDLFAQNMNFKEYDQYRNQENYDTQEDLYEFKPHNHKIPKKTNQEKTDFIELGAIDGNLPQESEEFGFMTSGTYKYPRRMARSIISSQAEPLKIMNNNNVISRRKGKGLLSKRKQKLYQTENQKKWLKKYYDSDVDNDYFKHNENVKMAVKNISNGELRSKRSAKAKKKKSPFYYKGKKVKRQTETTASDAKADEHVKSIPDIDGKITTKPAEHIGIQIIKSNLAKMKQKVDKKQVDFQNNVKLKKEEIEQELGIDKGQSNVLRKVQHGQKRVLNSDDSNGKTTTDSSISTKDDLDNVEEQLKRRYKSHINKTKALPKLNTLLISDKIKEDMNNKPQLKSDVLKTLPIMNTNHITDNIHKDLDSKMQLKGLNLKELPTLAPFAISDKINKDIEELKERLNNLLHINTKSKLIHPMTFEELGAENKVSENKQGELYHPLVEMTKVTKNKRKPLYIEHKQKMSLESNMKGDKHINHDIQKRQADNVLQEPSIENMILTNSIEQANYDQDFDNSAEEIAQEIIIIDDLDDIGNPVKQEQEIIIRNMNGENINAEEIILTSNENVTLEEFPLLKNHTTNIIEDVAHTLSSFMTYLHSKIKYFLPEF